MPQVHQEKYHEALELLGESNPFRLGGSSSGDERKAEQDECIKARTFFLDTPPRLTD